MMHKKQLQYIAKAAAGKIAAALAVVAFCAATFIISAYAKTYTVGELLNVADGIVAYEEAQTGASSVQNWLDGELTDGAGATSEWYVIALRQSGKTYDYSSYANALEAYLAANNTGATSSQKYALALIAAGRYDSTFVKSAVAQTIGQQGIMSWIYGLNLLNNGLDGSEYSATDVISQLLSLRLSDGGWALTGDVSNVDVTAMAVQALAPHYTESDDIKSAVDVALDFLSTIQLEDGDYSSYGVENPESTAQVVVALSALGIDCQTDSRFIKNGNTLIDGMIKFKLDDGSFAHKAGGGYNHTATVQTYYSLIAYLRCADGRGSLYVFDKTEPTAVSDTSVTTEPVTTGAADSAAQTDSNTAKPINYKFWGIFAVGAAAVIICAGFWLVGKRHPKNFIFIIGIGAVIMLVIGLTDFKSTTDFYGGDTESKANIIGTVTLTIRCDTIKGKADSEYVPDDGIILDTTNFDIAEGETVYDVLVEAVRTYNIQMENEGSALGAHGMTYISGINYIYEFDYGDLSGWIYHVNGVQPSVNCGDYTLKAGDKIEWLYTLDLGNDLETEQ
jgi:hypothetical protein